MMSSLKDWKNKKIKKGKKNMVDYYEIALKIEETASPLLFFFSYKFYYYWACIFLFGSFITLKFASMDEDECKKEKLMGIGLIILAFLFGGIGIKLNNTKDYTNANVTRIMEKEKLKNIKPEILVYNKNILLEKGRRMGKNIGEKYKYPGRRYSYNYFEWARNKLNEFYVGNTSQDNEIYKDLKK